MKPGSLAASRMLFRQALSLLAWADLGAYVKAVGATTVEGRVAAIFHRALGEALAVARDAGLRDLSELDNQPRLSRAYSAARLVESQDV